MKHEDNRVVTIPVHANKSLGKGLLRTILRDAELTVEQFQEILLLVLAGYDIFRSMVRGKSRG